MHRRMITGTGQPQAIGYAQAVETVGATRLLFVSGQVPVTADGTAPEGIAAQTRQAWSNVLAVLAEAGMTPDHLVKVTVILSDRAFRSAVNAISDEMMNGRLVSWTTIVAGTVREDWLVEIEAIAAA